MSKLDFTPKTREIIKKRANTLCEIHTRLEYFSDDGVVPEDFPKIDLRNPLHSKLEEHHCNFKSNADPYLHEDWNGMLIYKFYHDIVHGKYQQHLKWTKPFVMYCQMVASGRMPIRTDSERNEDRIERNAKKMVKNSATRKKNAIKRKENPSISAADRQKYNKKPVWVGEKVTKKNNKVKLSCHYDRFSNKLIQDKQ